MSSSLCLAHCFQRLVAAAFAVSSSSNSFAFAAAMLRLLRRDHPSPASSRQAGQPCCGRRPAATLGLADVCPHHETERGVAAKVLGRPVAQKDAGGS